LTAGKKGTFYFFTRPREEMLALPKK